MLGELRSCSALYPHLSSVPFHSRLPGLGGESGMAQDEPSWKMDTERSRITSLEAPSSWRGTEIGISWVLLHENLPPAPAKSTVRGIMPSLLLVSPWSSWTILLSWTRLCASPLGLLMCLWAGWWVSRLVRDVMVGTTGNSLHTLSHPLPGYLRLSHVQGPASKKSDRQHAKPLEAQAWNTRQVASGHILLAKAGYRASPDSRGEAQGSIP